MNVVLTELLKPIIIQHPRIHLRESQRRTKGKGKDGLKRGDTSSTRWIRGKGLRKHNGSGKPRANAHYANFNYADDYDVNEPADAYQAHNDPVDPGSDHGDEALDDDDDDEENDTFSSYLALDDVSFYEAAELDANCSSCRHVGH